MEIYCLAKAGGVQGQIEAAQALLAREKVALEAKIAAIDNSDSRSNQTGLLKQETLELENSTQWRISQLKKIQPEEEKAVSKCWKEIEAVLGAVQK